MASGLLSGLGKLVNAGAAYLQHVSFANQALGATPADVVRQLRAYTQGLSDAGFAGLKVTLSMLVNQEHDPARKAGLQRLLESADTARRGELPRDVPAPASPGPTQSFDDDLALLGRWYDELDGPGRQRALVAHVRQLTPAGYRQFASHVQQMVDNCASRIQEHQSAEGNSWGGSIEDRITYGMARLQTGQRDPAWQQRMNMLQDVQAFFQAVLAASHQLWAERQRIEAEPPRSKPMPMKAAVSPPSKGRGVDPQAVLAGVRELTRTGHYPGGTEQLKADITALAMSGQADAVMAELEAMGANDVGSKALVIEDHYVDGPEPFRQRWPIQFPLPVPFDELPRQVQFSVLFGEWSRREMEGTSAMLEGRNDDARAAYRECLERAQQIGVKELVARSHEGLARVASKLNDRALERQHLKAAITARAAA